MDESIKHWLVIVIIFSFWIVMEYVKFRRLKLKRNRAPPSEVSHAPYADCLQMEKLSRNLSRAVTYRTINYGSGNLEKDQLKKMHTFLEKTFPLVHSCPLVQREVVNELSLLYHVKGSDESLKPYMLCGHMDVVPVEESEWIEPPFQGVVKDGWIWGRGTVDCKHLVMGTLEALEYLICGGYQPGRSFYLAFGHDEESGGESGAREIGILLKSKGIQMEFILDEGTFVADGIAPGVEVPIAFIGISEKSQLNLKLSVHGTPVYSSAPPKKTVIRILAEVLAKLKSDPRLEQFGKAGKNELSEALVPYAKFPYDVIYANEWLFKFLIMNKLKKSLFGAIYRTSTAVTAVSGGTKENIIPSSATARVNHRIHPAQIVSEVYEFVKNAVKDGPLFLQKLSQFEAHPISPIHSFGYKIIKNTILRVLGECCVAPITILENTDTRWYLDLSKSIYRFSIVHPKAGEVPNFHGHNEKISQDNYLQVVQFYIQLIKGSDI